MKKKNYPNQLKRLLKKPILDFIIFGSSVKDGIPHDVDIAVIIDRGADISFIKKAVKDLIPKADIEVVDIDSLYSPLWLTLIKEGYSIRKGRFLSDMYKITPKVLFKYSLKKLNPSQKVLFQRGLNNTMKKGERLTRSVLLVPIGEKNAIEELLKSWNIYYECQEYELLPVLVKPF